jgi:hypothetical protein
MACIVADPSGDSTHELTTVKQHLGNPIGRLLIFTPSQFAELCAANPEAVPESSGPRSLLDRVRQL